MPPTQAGAGLGAYPTTHLRRLGAWTSSMLTNTWSARRAIFEMVPRDMRTADPTRGAELAEGYFALGDASIELDGRNLFDVAPPSERFAALLHSFRWLRHMRAHAHPGTKLLARTYVLQWVAKRREHPRIAMAPDVAAKRALCLTNQAAYLLDDADSADYRAIMESIIADVRLAFTHRALIADPTERCAIALSCASVANALTGHKALQRKTLAVLDRSLRDALHRDGGPVTRRPTDLAQLLAEMLSLRALLEARNVPIPQRLTMGITDAMRTMRMLRHPDGSLARFQGAADLTHLARGLVASITTYDTERGPLPAEAPETGYVRLEGTSGLVLADVGGPPAVNAGSRAHASCLAFEWSIGAEKVVTNSPPPWQGRFSNQLDHRRTMAHSTVSMDGQSSAQFATPELDSPIVSAGFTVSHTLDKSDGEATLSAQHTGYRKRYGVDHARTLTLSPSGRQLEGKDSFQLKTGTPARTVRTPYTLHFHLEPGLRVKMLGEQSCRITTAMRTILFEVDQGQLRVTDPGHEDYHGPAQSIELSVSSTPAELPEISWRFRVEREEGAQVDAEATAVEEVEAPAEPPEDAPSASADAETGDDAPQSEK